VSVAALSVWWNSLADYLRDPALELNIVRRQLKTFLFAHCYAQCIERIRDIATVRYINFLFTYNFSYLLIYFGFLFFFQSASFFCFDYSAFDSFR